MLTGDPARQPRFLKKSKDRADVTEKSGTERYPAKKANETVITNVSKETVFVSVFSDGLGSAAAPISKQATDKTVKSKMVL